MAVYVVKLFGGWRAFSTPGCRTYDFRVERERPTRPTIVFGK